MKGSELSCEPSAVSRCLSVAELNAESVHPDPHEGGVSCEPIQAAATPTGEPKLGLVILQTHSNSRKRSGKSVRTAFPKNICIGLTDDYPVLGVRPCLCRGRRRGPGPGSGCPSRTGAGPGRRAAAARAGRPTCRLSSTQYSLPDPPLHVLGLQLSCTVLCSLVGDIHHHSGDVHQALQWDLPRTHTHAFSVCPPGLWSSPWG